GSATGSGGVGSTPARHAVLGRPWLFQLPVVAASEQDRGSLGVACQKESASACATAVGRWLLPRSDLCIDPRPAAGPGVGLGAGDGVPPRRHRGWRAALSAGDESSGREGGAGG